MIAIKIPNRIYHIPIHVFIGKYNDYNRYIKNTFKTIIEDNGDKADGITVPIKDDGLCNIITVWLSRLNINDAYDLSVLTHECVHASTMIFEKIGAKIELDNDEHVAYMSQYIFEQTVLSYKLNKKSKKGKESNGKTGNKRKEQSNGECKEVKKEQCYQV